MLGCDQTDIGAAGWAVIPAFLEAGDLTFCAAAVDAVLSLPQHPGMSRPGNDLVPLRWDHPVVERILTSGQHVSRLRRVLGARDLRWLSAKPPYSPPLWWHQDWWCWGHPISFERAAAQVAVLCYLTDTDAQNGALRILPGSHLRSMPIHKQLPEPHGAQANQLPAGHPAMADCLGRTTPTVRAGDAVVLDYRVLHGTHANESRRRRDSILLSFIPNWCALPMEIKAHLIAHPALPSGAQAAARSASGYDDLLPQFDGERGDLAVNRLPPEGFTVH